MNTLEQAEEYFDTIDTMHLNPNIKMPKTEMFELMSGFAKEYAKAKLAKVKVTRIFLDEPSDRCGVETNIGEIIKEIENE